MSAKKALVAIVQVTVAASLITLLVWRMDNRDDILAALKDIAAHWPMYVLALLCSLAGMLSCAQRWRLLLAVHDIPVSFRRATMLTFIGHFYNAFMFGSTGGDVVKAIYVTREVQDKRTEAASTIFVDRIVGLMALLLFAAGIMTVRFDFFMTYPETRIAMFFIGGLIAAALLVFVIAFRQNVFEQWAIFRRLEERTSLGRVLAKVYTAFHGCLTHPATLAKAMGYSLFNQFILVVLAWCLGSGLEIRTWHPPEVVPTAVATVDAEWYPLRELANYTTVMPFVNAIASIPATPGGLGTREAAATFLFGVPEFGVPASRAVMLALLFYSVAFFWSLFGGALVMLYKPPRPAPESAGGNATPARRDDPHGDQQTFEREAS